jgi:hypothetical protein
MELEQKRIALHEYLCNILGSRNCYYSPPTGMEMNYPCIVYDLAGQNNLNADNLKYLSTFVWEITIIDEDPDSSIASKALKLPRWKFDRKFSSDDLNHFVFTLNY